MPPRIGAPRKFFLWLLDAVRLNIFREVEPFSLPRLIKAPLKLLNFSAAENIRKFDSLGNPG